MYPHYTLALAAICVSLAACAPAGTPSPNDPKTLHFLGGEAPLEQTQALWWAGVQNRMAAQERAIRTVHEHFEAALPHMGATAYFDGQAVELRSDSGALLMTLRTEAWGREDRLRTLEDQLPSLGSCTSEIDVRGDCVQRLEYDHGDLMEWWVGRDDGIEQGWTINEPPVGTGDLLLQVETDGSLGAQPTSDELEITDASGTAWQISSAVAWDAVGRDLPVRFAAQGQGFELRIDDTDALYPVTIDPLYSSVGWMVLGDDEPYFGLVTTGGGDLDGDGYDDVVVGTEYAGSQRGVVFVYYGSSTGLPADPDTILYGQEDDGEFAQSLAIVGDVDADGYDDLLVGAPTILTTDGSAHLYLGSATGLATEPDQTIHGAGLVTHFGYNVSGAGDVNGDGYDDVIVGEHGYTLTSTYNGSAYVFVGGPSGLDSSAFATFPGTGVGDAFGYAVSSAGDVDGDGYDDVLVGAPYASSGGGQVHLYQGGAAGMSTSPAVTVTGIGTSTYLGTQLAAAGDVDGDGYDDVALGAYRYGSYSGRVWIHHGGVSGLSTSATTTLAGSSGDGFGHGLAPLGDLNGDGYDDLAIGAYGYDHNDGRAYVYMGSASGLPSTATSTHEAEESYERLGYSISTAGDVDGDGDIELLVGAPYNGDNEGAAHLYLGSGSTISSSASASLFNPVPRFDSPVPRGIGDVDGDGYDDLAVGCPNCGSTAGSVNVFYGGAAGPSSFADVSISGGASDYLGYALDGAGDVNGDGYDDLVVGAWGDGFYEGDVRVYMGSSAGLPSTASATLEGLSRSDKYGYEVIGAGDVNGDGYDDVAVQSMGITTVYVHHGSSSGLDATASTTLTSTTSRFGERMAAGDANGDGYSDLAVAGGLWSSTTGIVRVYYGSSSGIPTSAARTLNGSSSGDYFGNGMAFCDTDGDGYDELLIGAYGSLYGKLDVYDGGPSGYASTASATWSGTPLWRSVGEYVDCAGDVDADGYEDALLSASTLEIWLGSASGLSSGSVFSNFVGEPTSAGDVNGDGYDDAAVGWWGHLMVHYGYSGAPDLDGDGSPSTADCDDTDPSVYPGAEELCDGVDNDCDGAIDEDTESWYPDSDGDGYGDAAGALAACARPSGYVADDSDCDDSAGDVYPGAPETCDGRDEDCDGLVDEVGATGDRTFYLDGDGDGYGDPSQTIEDCTAPSGYVSDATDCDDGNPGVNPRAIEACDGVDNDCDGAVDEAGASGETTWYFDRDGDGYGDPASAVAACVEPSGAIVTGGDCDDSDPAVNPSASETCDGVDNDCDGALDEAGAIGESTWYTDADGDGYGDPSSSATACSEPTGWVADNSDCDDSAAAVNPAAVEACDGVDNDCDGAADEAGAIGETTWYYDGDGDGYGDGGSSVTSCTMPAGFAAVDTDCDDSDASVHPSASELCDGVDNDCDGDLDEGMPADAPLWFLDSDGDGYGSGSYTRACHQPSGYVDNYDDCDDDDASVSPGALEQCDGVDNDCDGDVDDADSDVFGAPTWFLDGDADGFGTSAESVEACSEPMGYSANDDDCDDSRSGTHPGADEYCGGGDEDCDGTVDEGDAVDAATWYRDGDADGLGSARDPYNACEQPSGYVADATDCDDNDAEVGGPTSFYADSDGDGWGDRDAEPSQACDAPSGSVDNAEDCDDSDATVNPDAPEIWYDGVDQDCDGNDADQDGDGVDWPEDCDDEDPARSEGCELPDSGGPADPKDDGEVKGCTSAGQLSAEGWLLALLPLAFVRRRRGPRSIFRLRLNQGPLTGLPSAPSCSNRPD